MVRGEEAHSTRDAETIESFGERLRRREATVSQRISSLSESDTQRSRARYRSACGLMGLP